MVRETRELLLDAAETAVRTRGYTDFSFADLSKAVGIRKASIHYHFPTKSDLSLELMCRYTSQMDQARLKIDAKQQTAGVRLDAMIRHYRAALHNGAQVCLCVSMTLSLESLTEPVRRKVAAFREAMILWLTDVFAAGRADGSIGGTTDVEADARATLALLEGAHLAARTEGNAQSFDLALSALRTRIAVS